MKNFSLLFLIALPMLSLSACDSLEQTDLIRSEMVTAIKGDTLYYQMYQTGLDKYRYEFNLVNNRDTTHLFNISFSEASASQAGMDIEQGKGRIKIILNKQIEPQTKTVKGVTYELVGKK